LRWGAIRSSIRHTGKRKYGARLKLTAFPSDPPAGPRPARDPGKTTGSVPAVAHGLWSRYQAHGPWLPRQPAADGAGLIDGHAKPTEKLHEPLKRRHFSEARASSRRGFGHLAGNDLPPPVELIGKRHYSLARSSRRQWISPALSRVRLKQAKGTTGCRVHGEIVGRAGRANVLLRSQGTSMRCSGRGCLGRRPRQHAHP
jgi:hypothetical protein